MGARKRPLTRDELIRIVGELYPKVTPDKILAHIERTYGEKIRAHGIGRKGQETGSTEIRRPI